MKNKHLLMALLLGAAITGCKTDSEDDLPGWGDSTDGPQVTASAVVINEVCGKQDPDDDWIELYNNSGSEVDMGGCKIVKTDEDGLDEDIYTFPQGAGIAPGGYLVIATLSGELQAGISNSKEVGLTLVAADGSVLDRFDRDSDIGKDVSHPEGGSYARKPDGTGQWTVTDRCTRGTSNGGAQATEPNGIRLNEICGKQDPDDDWIEICNTGDTGADISGMRIVKTDEDGLDEDIYTFPANSVVAPGGRIVISTLTGQLTAGISNTKDLGLTLVMPDGNVLDSFNRDSDIGDDVSHPKGGSYARIPDGTGQWTVAGTATRGTANN